MLTAFAVSAVLLAVLMIHQHRRLSAASRTYRVEHVRAPAYAPMPAQLYRVQPAVAPDWTKPRAYRDGARVETAAVDR